VPANAPSTNVSIDVGGRIGQDVHCIHCGYNLRSLLPQQACPECNQPVSESLRGNLLQFSDPTWLTRLVGGMNWMIVGTVLWLLWNSGMGPLSWLGYGSTGVLRTMIWSLPVVIGFTSRAVSLVGAWTVTWAEPRALGVPLAPDLRTLARILLTAGFLLTCALWRLPSTFGVASELIHLAPRILMLLGWICLYVHLTGLARRVPDVPLVRLTYVAIVAMALEHCLGSAFQLWLAWAMPAIQAGTVAMPRRLYLSISFLSLANTILLLVVQILYRRRFGQAHQQSRRGQSAAVPTHDTLGD
jgi:hypothetical protein